MNNSSLMKKTLNAWRDKSGRYRYGPVHYSIVGACCISCFSSRSCPRVFTSWEMYIPARATTRDRPYRSRRCVFQRGRPQGIAPTFMTFVMCVK